MAKPKEFKKDEIILFYSKKKNETDIGIWRIGKVLFKNKLYINCYCILGENDKVYEYVPNYQIDTYCMAKVLEKRKEIQERYDEKINKNKEYAKVIGEDEITERRNSTIIDNRLVYERNASIDKLSDERINHFLKEVE